MNNSAQREDSGYVYVLEKLTEAWASRHKIRFGIKANQATKYWNTSLVRTLLSRMLLGRQHTLSVAHKW